MLKVFKWVVGVLAATVVTLVVVILVVLLSRQPGLDVIPGGRLSGEEVPGRVTDWSFMQQHRLVTLEVRPSDPYSVNTSCFYHEGVLYVRSSPRFPLKQVRQLIWGSGESRWAQFLLLDPTMRLKVGEKIYNVQATQVEDSKLVREIYDNQIRDRGGTILTPTEASQILFFRID